MQGQPQVTMPNPATVSAPAVSSSTGINQIKYSLFLLQTNKVCLEENLLTLQARRHKLLQQQIQVLKVLIQNIISLCSSFEHGHIEGFSAAVCLTSSTVSVTTSISAGINCKHYSFLGLQAQRSQNPQTRVTVSTATPASLQRSQHG